MQQHFTFKVMFMFLAASLVANSWYVGEALSPSVEVPNDRVDFSADRALTGDRSLDTSLDTVSAPLE